MDWRLRILAAALGFGVVGAVALAAPACGDCVLHNARAIEPGSYAITWGPDELIGGTMEFDGEQLRIEQGEVTAIYSTSEVLLSEDDED